MNEPPRQELPGTDVWLGGLGPIRAENIGFAPESDQVVLALNRCFRGLTVAVKPMVAGWLRVFFLQPNGREVHREVFFSAALANAEGEELYSAEGYRVFEGKVIF